MIAVLIWLAGCIFGAWCIWHFDLWRPALDLAICGSWMLWVIAGAAWLGRRAGPARRSAALPGPGHPFWESIQRAQRERAEKHEAAK
jgi:hypothetical protein